MKRVKPKPTSPTSRRAELLHRLSEAARHNSTATVLFHGAIAERLGLNPTDHKCADLLFRFGAMTAGDLAERTGLTTGAITGVIDRLEAVGFVRRARDPGDRRRVIVEPVRDPATERRVGALFAPLERAFRELTAGYDDQQLAFLTEVLTRAAKMMEEETARLRAATES